MAWQNPHFLSVIFFLRDVIIFILPVKRLPRVLVKLLYGISPRFVFLVHARRTEDTYVGLPILSVLRRILGKKIFLRILSWVPPLVLGTVKTPQGVNGLIVTGGGLLPEVIFLKKKASLKKAVQCLIFSAKLCERNSVFGLGGLWPMVTRRGFALVPFAKKYEIVITNGHCGTLMSLYLSIQKMASLSEIPIEKLKVMILGVGKMGANLARALYGKVASITLVDVNEKRLGNLEKKLRENIAETDIFKFLNREEVGKLSALFENNHVIVCTTSNVKRVLRPSDIPINSIIIDDSRPEAIPRDLNQKGVVLEGGLLKIRGLKQGFNFGLGLDDNVFGCLAESFILAVDGIRKISNTLGEVSIENFNKMIEYADALGISAGDFKCREQLIDPQTIISLLRTKTNLAATIPFKKVCWLLKVDDLGVT
ncbi:MAG: hypothetical protein HYS56_02860 [Candidatus Omnitrophica bacterium]|nr:hypothetical protein [Candidatus Omnitrophota bacterium]